MRQLRVIGAIWAVLGSLGACALLVASLMRPNLPNPGAATSVILLIVFMVLVAFAGYRVRQGSIWAQTALGILSLVLLAYLSCLGMEFAPRGNPVGFTTEGYLVLGGTLAAIGFAAYTLAVILVAERRRMRSSESGSNGGL